jgi:hypothetical protein
MKEEGIATQTGRGPWSRARDKREGLAGLVTYLVADAEGPEPSSIRTRFEEGLRRLLNVRSVQLRDGVAVIPATPGQSPVEAMCLQVPAGAASRPAMLQAAFDTSSVLDDWALQLLHGAAQLATLVLDSERARAGAVAIPAPVKWRRDNVSPLVGGSQKMQALRARI